MANEIYLSVLKKFNEVLHYDNDASIYVYSVTAVISVTFIYCLIKFLIGKDKKTSKSDKIIPKIIPKKIDKSKVVDESKKVHKKITETPGIKTLKAETTSSNLPSAVKKIDPPEEKIIPKKDTPIAAKSISTKGLDRNVPLKKIPLDTPDKPGDWIPVVGKKKKKTKDLTSDIEEKDSRDVILLNEEVQSLKPVYLADEKISTFDKYPAVDMNVNLKNQIEFSNRNDLDPISQQKIILDALAKANISDAVGSLGISSEYLKNISTVASVQESVPNKNVLIEQIKSNDPIKPNVSKNNESVAVSSQKFSSVLDYDNCQKLIMEALARANVSNASEDLGLSLNYCSSESVKSQEILKSNLSGIVDSQYLQMSENVIDKYVSKNAYKEPELKHDISNFSIAKNPNLTTSGFDSAKVEKNTRSNDGLVNRVNKSTTSESSRLHQFKKSNESVDNSVVKNMSDSIKAQGDVTTVKDSDWTEISSRNKKKPRTRKE